MCGHSLYRGESIIERRIIESRKFRCGFELCHSVAICRGGWKWDSGSFVIGFVGAVRELFSSVVAGGYYCVAGFNDVVRG